jgi:hypothetical protein
MPRSHVWLAAAAVAAIIGCGGEDEPSGGPLSGDDLQRPWLQLYVPHALEAAHVARGAAGFLAVSREMLGGKAILAVNNYLYRSDDGVRWQRLPLEQAPGEFFGFRGLAYGNGRYVMARSWGGRNELWTSSDGQQWSRQTFQLEASQIAHVTFVQGRFFALTTWKEVFTSEDGGTWTIANLGTTVQPDALTYGHGRFLVVGSGPMQLSFDGLSWRPVSLDCALPGACITDPSGGVGQAHHFHAVFAADRFYVDQLTSGDGMVWQLHGELVPTDYVGGYLFGADQNTLTAWKPTMPPTPLAVESVPPPVTIAEGSAPDTIDALPPTGETCLTHRCLIVDGALYLIR